MGHRRSSLSRSVVRDDAAPVRLALCVGVSPGRARCPDRQGAGKRDLFEQGLRQRRNHQGRRHRDRLRRNHIEADVIDGADCIHSVVRKILFGESVARFTNQICWRAMVPMEIASRHGSPGVTQPTDYIGWIGRPVTSFAIRCAAANTRTFPPVAFRKSGLKSPGQFTEASMKCCRSIPAGMKHCWACSGRSRVVIAEAFTTGSRSKIG